MGAPMVWLNANAGIVTALATVAGVLVATAYSIFAAFQWRATKRQADLTQAMFEASHRPYLTVTAKAPVFLDGRIVLLFDLKNRGTVPAIVTSWHISARSRAQALPIRPATISDVARAVFANDQPLTMRAEISESDGVTIRGTSELVLIETTVTYHGVAKRDYATRAVWELTSTPELTLWDCRELRMDP